MSASVFAADSTKTTWITELALTIPVKTSTIKTYLDANGVVPIPLGAGYTSGARVSRHAIITQQATIGGSVTANCFVGSGVGATVQIYQLQAFVVGRIYFGESWRGGAFCELGSGLELTAAKFASPFIYQINIGSVAGIGYNYELSSAVTIGASVLVSPALLGNGIGDSAKLAIGMQW